MRTTLTLDDQLASDLKEAAHRSGKPFKQVVNEALYVGLHELSQPRGRPYRLRPTHMGTVRTGIDLDKALDLADRLEQEAIADKLEQRK